jgi:SAM-dependent methyltransferase
MGLDVNGTKFLLYARQMGVSFAETAMVGRQEMLANAETLKANFKTFGHNLGDAEIDRIVSAGGGYAEPFLEKLGASEIVSFDASDYENASVSHDFNQPIPAEFRNRFSVVLDGGTLEHVFNFPNAIKNCMQMLKVGGHFLAIAPTNNYTGHGFYQFSPELFFRVFTEQNGFEMQRMLIYEETLDCDWFEVPDPDSLKERVTLINEEPSLLLVVAKKVAEAEIFATAPQQSDYFSLWNADDAESTKAAIHNGGGDSVGTFGRFAISAAKHLQRSFNRKYGELNRKKHFKKVDLNGG